jgi:hypothetical protein
MATYILEGRLDVISPKSGSHVYGPEITVMGPAWPGTHILRDVREWFDPTVAIADAQGLWSCVWPLESGENKITLHTAGKEDHVTITVYNDGPSSSSQYSGCTVPPAFP